MKHKKLILTILMTLCMTIVAGFGVYATIASSLSISGTLNFVALTKEVYVNEIKLSNYVDADFNIQTSTLQNFNGKYLKENASVSLGSGLNVVTGETLEIAITMTNLTSNYLRANLSYSNLGTVSITTTGLIMPINSGETVETGQPRTIKIYVKNTTAETVNLSSLSLTISFTSLGTTLLQDSGSLTTANGDKYYYVEMGTLPNTAGTGAEYIKWRYISSNTSSSYTYDSSTVPTGTGYFILESDTLRTRTDNTSLHLNACSYNTDFLVDCVNHNDGDDMGHFHQQNGWTNIQANDYATSTIRQYINGEKVHKVAKQKEIYYEEYDDYDYIYTPDETMDYSDMLTDFCIDKENDIVYNKIIGRTLSDLYKANSADGVSDVAYPTFNEGAEVISSTEVDKFWIPSYSEILNMLCGGTWSKEKANWILSSSIYDWYWLRSPASTASHYIVEVTYLGGHSTGGVSHEFYPARACFKMTV